VRPEKHALHELTARSLKGRTNISLWSPHPKFFECIKGWDKTLGITVSESSSRDKPSSQKEDRKQMELSNIQIVECTLLPPDEAWIICNRDAPQIPESLRATLPVPCVLTGDADQAKRMLNLLRATSFFRSKPASRETSARKMSR
jgi:hypothetical protein